jgi:hypothetical protein
MAGFNTASLDQLNLAIEKCEYRNFPKAILDYARRVLSKTAQDLYLFLTAEAVYHEHKMVKISRQSMADAIFRSVKTVGRLLNELQSKSFILRKRTRPLSIYVRAPKDIVEKMLIKNTRRPRCIKKDQRDIFVPLKKATHINYINTNNNKYNNTQQSVELRDKSDHEPSDNKIIVSFLNKEVPMTNSTEQNKRLLADAEERMRKTEQELSRTKERYDQKMMPFRRKEEESMDDYLEKVRSIYSEGIKEAQGDMKRLVWLEGYRDSCKVEINSLKSHLLEESDLGKNNDSQNSDRKVDAYFLNKIKDSVKDNNIVRQMVYEIEKGTLRKSYRNGADLSIQFAIAIALKRYREGKWLSAYTGSRRSY